MASDWKGILHRWVGAGLVPAETAAAIERWEAERPRSRLNAPILVCLALGAVLLAAGLLLFVAAHWDNLAPAWRFSLILTLLIALHGFAAASARGFPSLAVALHAVGSIALGAGIFLVAQIFHLEAHWPGGLLLWALGAGLGWFLLRQWPQLALLALLAPAWLVSEWVWLCGRLLPDSLRWSWQISGVPAAGVLLLSVVYLGAPRSTPTDPPRRVLLWLGGLGLIPAAWAWIDTFPIQDLARQAGIPPWSLPMALTLGSWTVAIGGPLLLGWWLRGRQMWPMAVAAGWILASVRFEQPITPWSYAWRALGGVLLVAWGLRENRSERINLGTALVALTVIAFYFAEVMDKLERSLSLVLLGVLCLGGGWGLEWLRRRMLARLDSLEPEP